VHESVAVVIPAFRAAAHLADVVAGVARHIPLGQVYVVNDGSPDTTAEVARRSGAVVLEHNVNRGKGAALDTGIRRAASDGYAFAITLDADGQHNPDDIPRFIDCQRETQADLVVGNRMAAPHGMPALRLWTNHVTSMVISLLARARVRDSQNGYRMIRIALYKSLPLASVRYEAESELIIRAGRKGARVVSVPVETIYSDEISAIHPIVDTGRFLRLVWRSFFW